MTLSLSLVMSLLGRVRGLFESPQNKTSIVDTVVADTIPLHQIDSINRGPVEVSWEIVICL